MITYPQIQRPSRRFECVCHFGTDDVSLWHFATCLASAFETVMPILTSLAMSPMPLAPRPVPSFMPSATRSVPVHQGPQKMAKKKQKKRGPRGGKPIKQEAQKKKKNARMAEEVLAMALLRCLRPADVVLMGCLLALRGAAELRQSLHWLKIDEY